MDANSKNQSAEMGWPAWIASWFPTPLDLVDPLDVSGKASAAAEQVADKVESAADFADNVADLAVLAIVGGVILVGGLALVLTWKR